MLSFDGRISRYDFWLKGIIPIVFASLSISLLDLSITGGTSIISILGNILLVYLDVAVGVKRFHDRNKSGWWYLIVLIPIVGGLWFLVECGFLRGTDGDNDYGPDPLAKS